MLIMRLLLSTLLLLGLLAGCSSKDQKPSDMGEREIYEAAQRNLKDESYALAIRNLQLLEARYPFGPYASHAQLELIHAHYRNHEPEAAIAAADRFIRLHPQHPSIDYAYYMRGLANYTEGMGLLDRFLPTDTTQRDPGSAIQAFEDFQQLLHRFPDSRYAADARARMTYLRARLARHEINVANYYFKRKAYLAAANRGRHVVENFPQTPAVGDALAVMVQASRLLELEDLATAALAFLHTTYPDPPAPEAMAQFKARFHLCRDDSRRSWLILLTLGLSDRSAPPAFHNRADYPRP